MITAWIAIMTASASAQWMGFVDESAALGTDRFPFIGAAPGEVSNENYYDGDIGDIDGDGYPDRLLGARFGLLYNTGGGYMVNTRKLVGLLLRGDAGASGWGEDAMGLIDVDDDGDLDALMGGNGEPLTCQINQKGRFSLSWTHRRSALNIVPTDVENDGDADIFVAHAFCADRSCGGPVQFSLLVNDGTGTYTEESATRGLDFTTSDFIVGVASGDVDGDGDFDALIARGLATGGSMIVALNDGTGRFTQRVTTIPTLGSGFAQGVSLGDVDDDGDLDLLVGHAGTYTGGHPVVGLVLAENDGDGNFTDRSAAWFDDGGSTSGIGGGNVLLADVDYDHDLDIVAVERAGGTMQFDVAILLNDGRGRFTYSTARSLAIPARSMMGLGIDIGLGDMDRDGDYDLWLGFGADHVHILMNDYRAAAPPDVPPGLRVVSADASSVTIGWRNPSFAANARYYRVYRSLSGRLEGRDHRLIGTAGRSAHLDQDFFGHVDRHTTTAELADPNASIDAATGEVRFTDRNVVPGVRYYYSVVHVGPESAASAWTDDVTTVVPGAPATDTIGPELEIVSPTTDEWSRSPRIALAYGDASGIDPSTLRVSFDRALGPLAAGTDLASMGYRRDDESFLAFLTPPHELPSDTLVTMTTSISDRAGNTTRRTQSFFVTVLPSITGSPMIPRASFTAAPMSGTAPIDVAFDGSPSDDPDGQIVRWEWYFGDGRTGLGRRASHRFDWAGTYDVTLLVRDTHGNIGTTTSSLTLDGPTMPLTDAGVPDAGAACTPSCAGRTCGDDGCAGTCGSCGADGTCAGGTCVCSGATEDCGGVCVDVRVDEANCGACGTTCAPTEQCNAGDCGPPGACTPDCTGRSCGDDGCGGTCGECPAGRTCAMGGMCLCSASETMCGSECVDLRTVARHCGACDRACAREERCSAGMCVPAGDADAGTGPDAVDGACACDSSRSGPSGLALVVALVVILRRRVVLGAKPARFPRGGKGPLAKRPLEKPPS